MLSVIGIVAIVVFAIYVFAFYKVTQPGGMDFSTIPEPPEKITIQDSRNIDSKLVIGSAEQSRPYQEYSKATFDANTGKKRVLFFYANWCETCRPADADFKANESSFPEDLVLFRVNYNDPDTDQEEKDLARKYGITYQHTFVLVDGEGNEVKKWNGGQTEKLLSSVK